MDLIIDTNIIKGGNYFRSNNFNILFDYLKKTNSKIVLPQTVKEESIWHYKSDIREKLNTVNHLSNLCFIAEISGEVDVDNEEKAYLNYIEILKKNRLLYEIDYDIAFLPEIIHRTINRIKPSKINGKEFKDVLIWLTIKKLLKEKKWTSFVFLSDNYKDFGFDNNSDLHPDLMNELQSEGLKLRYYRSITDFIKEHASRIEFVTRDWIKEELKEIDKKSVITTYIEDKLEQTLNIAYVHTYKVSVDLVDFYVYEGDKDINLFIEYEGEMTLEMGLSNGEIECSNMKIYPQLSSKIVDKKIYELIVDDCYWIR